MQPINYKNIELQESMVLVDVDATETDIIHEENMVSHRNKGKVIATSSDVTNCAVGDMVHFSDMAGIFPFKKVDRNKIVLHSKELLFISDDKNIFVGEDLTFYLNDLGVEADFNRRASI